MKSTVRASSCPDDFAEFNSESSFAIAAGLATQTICLCGRIGKTIISVEPSGRSPRLVHLTIMRPGGRFVCAPVAIDLRRVPDAIEHVFRARRWKGEVASAVWVVRDFEDVGEGWINNPDLYISRNRPGDWPTWALQSSAN